ncbi:hypothetical protein Lal_00006356 [Lupinus albus]|uniref:Uncharacterized protein n=1 Tax=Lupinus albus TaxID=3870 RepID=A0A6A4Q915_LUPAL|nr:hypothetical protein Lalb_Chr07g0182741 [Lupinus albus]KAF1875726.1 hypothetical protein Lal_00006356 [Lupinus albus]
MEPQRQVSSSSSSPSPSPSSNFATPSFSSYSSQNVAQIAARVIHQLTTLGDHSNENDDEEDDFEFALLSGDHNSSPVSADDIFSNGHIRQTYPLFDRTLLYDDVVRVTNTPSPPPRRRLPLRKLMMEEEGGDSCSASSSDDSNELNGVPQGTYCVWTPPVNKKSNSMGSLTSKRWKLRDLLLRSNSDGKKGQFFSMGPTKRSSTDGNGGGDISTLN